MTVAPKEITNAGLAAFLREQSNWGRWGPNDERGAPNLISPEKRVQAAGTVRTGRSISLSRAFPTEGAANNPRPAMQHLRVSAQPSGRMLATDYIGIDYHCPASTHVDALAHLWDDWGAWNGRRPADVIGPDGVLWGGVQHGGDGLVTRGVLIDIPSARGTDYVDVDEPVTDTELREIVSRQGLDIEPGDALVIFCGREAYERENGPWSSGGDQPGLDVSCLWSLRETDCSMVVWDMMDALPQPEGLEMPEPVHAALFHFGVALVDNALIEPLAVACREEGRSEFLLSVAPLLIHGGTGSPVNPLAVL